MRGVGVDVCQIARVEKALAEHGERFVARLLTVEERAGKKEWNAKALARRWALKEAVAKALGCGIGEVVGFHDIEISYTDKKQPVCRVKGFEGHDITVSTSDDGDYAVAMAVVDKKI